MWTILKNITDWTQYQGTAARQLHLVGVQIEWGKGPKEFPCLVTTYCPDPAPGKQPTLISAYVYQSDAEALLKAAGVTTAPPSTERAALPPGVVDAKQAQFNRWVSAHLLALVQQLVDRKEVFSRKDYEESLDEGLDAVRHWGNAAARKILSEDQRTLLDRLEPPG